MIHIVQRCINRKMFYPIRYRRVGTHPQRWQNSLLKRPEKASEVRNEVTERRKGAQSIWCSVAGSMGVLWMIWGCTAFDFEEGIDIGRGRVK